MQISLPINIAILYYHSFSVGSCDPTQLYVTPPLRKRVKGFEGSKSAALRNEQGLAIGVNLISSKFMQAFFEIFPIIRFGEDDPAFRGRTVSADIFCAEITAGKSQRLKKITTAVGKSKHEF
jgi:hypothetical protein